MPLAPGTKLGPYEIGVPLGAGGMGEVYRAKDTRLDRSVAIKILPTQFSADPVRKQRFEREAKTISSLNHPHICVLYDVGHQDGTDYLVMECVEGETLAKRLEKGPLPLEQVLKYGAQIADALDKAHHSGVVHRDLKPGNIVLATTGAKLLDFGLAKPVSPLVNEATLTMAARPPTPMTEEGTIVGTFQYMSPEQVEGKEVDGRSDIFSLGTVLYEMVTGKRAFEGKSQLSVASAILEKEPEPISAIKPLTPPVLNHTIRKCLTKLPDERWQSASDLASELRWIAESAGQASGAERQGSRAKAKEKLAWLIAAALLISMGVGVWWYHHGSYSAEQPQYHQLTFERGLIYAARFADDGRSVIYSASWEGQPVQLYSTDPSSPESRSLNLVNSTLFAVSDKELAISLGCNDLFIADCQGILARVPISGGTPREIAADTIAADWTADGNELAVIRRGGGKYRVEYPLGQVIYESEQPLWYLRIAPGGKAVAFGQFFTLGGDSGRLIVVDRSGKEVARTGMFNSLEGLAWSPTGEELWFGAAQKEGWADSIRALRLNGKQRVVVQLPGMLRLHDVSRDGRILLSKDSWRTDVRFRGTPEAKEHSLSWMDYANVIDISPDGKRVAFQDWGAAAGAVPLGYVRATDGSPPAKLGNWAAPVFSPEGKRVVAIDYSVADRPKLAVVPVGVGETKILKQSDMQQIAGFGWMPDGKRIYFVGNDGHGWRVYLQDLTDGSARAVTPGVSATGEDLLNDLHSVSPDGKMVFARDLAGKGRLYPIGGGEAKEIPGWLPKDNWAGWSEDGRTAYVFHNERTFATAYRLDLGTGKRQTVGTLAPPDPAGVTFINEVLYTPDGKAYVYTYQTERSDLFLVEGVR